MRNRNILAILMGLSLILFFAVQALAQAPITGWDKAKFVVWKDQKGNSLTLVINFKRKENVRGEEQCYSQYIMTYLSKEFSKSISISIRGKESF